MKTVDNPLSKIPSMQDFCLSIPLYRSFPFNDSDTGTLDDIEFFQGHIDCYCMDCKQPSVFHPEELGYHRRRGDGYYADKDLPIRCPLYCTRDDSHLIYFDFYIHNNTITKYGQYPSLSYLSSVEIRKYRKILDNQSYSEFSRAVELASNGIGIGSFVYLRRIFENLIEDVHQLYEDDCLDAFPIIKLGIELILDEKLQQRERDDKLKKTASEISKLTSRIKSSGK